ncbi:hypothetical protein [Lacticaseibacillus parakribbianus]|uniref:hypothetical protein n=1 Tax=Lacticaseibacillus parakribbianus TaxID=2970927 RepID=UPI0021CB28A3|nr:hypothetical protein [Lacticaseibacillus parakribbianus]
MKRLNDLLLLGFEKIYLLVCVSMTFWLHLIKSLFVRHAYTNAVQLVGAYEKVASHRYGRFRDAFRDSQDQFRPTRRQRVLYLLTLGYWLAFVVVPVRLSAVALAPRVIRTYALGMFLLTLLYWLFAGSTQSHHSFVMDVLAFANYTARHLVKLLLLLVLLVASFEFSIANFVFGLFFLPGIIVAEVVSFYKGLTAEALIFG